jgi:hypothetical protein
VPIATQTADLEAGKPTPELARDRQTVRRILTAFLFTFGAARLLALLIMARESPDLFLYLGSTHVHHLN